MKPKDNSPRAIFDKLVPVPDDRRCEYSWAWQNIKYDLEHSIAHVGTNWRLERLKNEDLRDWQEKLAYWSQRCLNTWGSNEREYAARHVRCVQDIIRMIVEARLKS